MADEPQPPQPAPAPAPQPEHQTLVLTDPPPEKHHVLLWSLCILAVALVTGGIVYAYWQLDTPNKVPEMAQEESATSTSQNRIDPKLIADLLDSDSYKYDLTLDGSVPANWIPDVATLVQLDEWFYQDINYIYSKNPHTRLLDRLTYADRPTFSVLQNSQFSKWAKDKQYVYDYGSVVQGANPNTFVVHSSDSSYANDGDILFYSTASILGLYESYAGIDQSTLQILSNGYAKDKNRVFFKANVLENVDPATVDFLGRPDCSVESNEENPWCKFRVDIYIKDKNSVFLVHEGFIGWDLSDMDPIPPLAEAIEDADPATFALVSGQDGYDAEDKNHKYLRGEIVE